MPATRFRLTAPEPLELDLHESLARALDALLLPPAQWACYPAGHVQLAPAEVARLARVGLKRGWPDVIILFEGLVFGLELKRRGGRLSKTFIRRNKRGRLRVYEGQTEVFPRLEAAGMTIAIVTSVEAALFQIRRWGLPLRQRA